MEQSVCDFLTDADSDGSGINEYGVAGSAIPHVVARGIGTE